MPGKRKIWGNNKGLDSATLVTVSNPCLPGSVVGEKSMDLARLPGK
jgi:hypothetical protein